MIPSWPCSAEAPSPRDEGDGGAGVGFLLMLNKRKDSIHEL